MDSRENNRLMESSALEPKPYRGGPPSVPFRGAGWTPEGRARASMNALRHGLAGRIVVLPTEDLAVYKKFSEELVESFQPATPFERQVAQTIADTQWRLNRARSFEDGILSMGHSGPVDADNSAIDAALSQANAFKDDSKAFVNLTLYEQRLHRQQKQAFEQLQALQAERKAEEQAALERAKLIHRMQKIKGVAEDIAVSSATAAVTGQEFVFSTARLDAEIARDRRWYEARLAQNIGYNRSIFESKLAKMAA